MTKTKSGFLKAGSIIAIVMSVLLVLTGFIFIKSSSLVTTDMVMYVAYGVENGQYRTITVTDGIRLYEFYDANGSRQIVQADAVDDVTTLAKSILKTAGIVSIVLETATLAIAICTLCATNKGQAKTGLIITQLVLALFSANLVTFAFMIVALCLKNKKVEQPEVEQPTVA